jgi:hypothetical protein
MNRTSRPARQCNRVKLDHAVLLAQSKQRLKLFGRIAVVAVSQAQAASASCLPIAGSSRTRSSGVTPSGKPSLRYQYQKQIGGTRFGFLGG